MINGAGLIANPLDTLNHIEQKRSLLYLYRSNFGETADDNDGIYIWAPVVSLLGMELHIVDTLSAKLPSSQEMSKYAGIIAPTGAWETSLKWTSWLTKQVSLFKRKVLVIAPLGAGDPKEEEHISKDYETVDDEELNKLYSAIGLSIDTSLSVEAGEGGENLVIINSIDKSVFGFDEDLTKHKTPYFLKMTGTDSSIRSMLTLSWKDVSDSNGLAVCSTEGGGYAIEEYIRRQDFSTEENFWYIDPLKFLIRVFQLRNLPVPEVARIGNSRIVTVFVEKCNKDLNSRFIQLYKFAGELDFPLTKIDKIPSIDEEKDVQNGVYSFVLNRKNILMKGLAENPEALLESYGEEYFGGRLSSDFRIVIFLDQDIFDEDKTIKALQRFLVSLNSSSLVPLNQKEIKEILKGAISLEHGVIAPEFQKNVTEGYYILGNNALRQVRVIAGDGYPDLSHCQNIMGYKKGNGRLLLHLGSSDFTMLRLSSQEQDQVYLSSFNRYVESFSFDKFRWVLHFRGTKDGKIHISGLNQGEKYVCEFFRKNSQRLFEERAFTSDLSGNMIINLVGKGQRRVEFWSDKDNSYWFVKIRRFFWATGTLPLFILGALFLVGYIIWKITRFIV